MSDLTVVLNDIVDPIFTANLPDKTTVTADPFDIMEVVENFLSEPVPKRAPGDDSAPPPVMMLSVICGAMRKAWKRPELKAHWCYQLWVAINDQIAGLDIVKKAKAIADPPEPVKS